MLKRSVRDRTQTGIPNAARSPTQPKPLITLKRLLQCSHQINALLSSRCRTLPAVLDVPFLLFFFVFLLALF
jgi:hypothetical protein